MKFIKETSPYIRKKANVKRMMLDVLIALSPLVVFAIIQNKMGAISVLLMSIVTFITFELFCLMLMKWPKGMPKKALFTKEGFNKIKEIYTINNITAPLISAIIYALTLPAYTNLYIVFIGALFAVVVVKMVFGGLGSNIFNPAAMGRILVGICFGTRISYLGGSVDVAAGGTPLGQISQNIEAFLDAIAKYPLLDLFLGNIPGAMGEVSALLIIIGALYLFIRRSADIRVCLSLLFSFTVIIISASVSANYNVIEFSLYHLLSGGLLFGAVFMATDPVTSPISKTGRIIFGSLIGVLVAFVRLIGAFPEGMVFAIAIMNMFVPVIDRYCPAKYNYKQVIVYSLSLLVLAIIVFIAV